MSQYRNANLLYRPSLSVWTARKKDKDESSKVNSSAGAVDGAANVHKALLPENPELKAVQQWATSFRDWIYKTTLPWDDTGWRIGRAQRHMDFMAEAGDRIRVGEQMVDDFIATYEQSIEKAKFTLNGMFNPMDYPTAGEVRLKFSFTIEAMTMPNTEDFRVVDGVEQDEVDRLVQVATSATEQRIADAMREAYSRLYEVVTKMASTLQQYGNKDIKKFNNSLLGNITALTAIMPALNLTDDPKLAELTRLAERLTTYNLGDLREVDETREAAIREASQLAKQFAFLKGADDPAPVPAARKVKAEPVTVVDAAVGAGIAWPMVENAAQQDRLDRAIADAADVPAALLVPVANDAAALAGGWGD